MKRKTKVFIGAGVFMFAIALNLQIATGNYGINPNSLFPEVLAESSQGCDLCVVKDGQGVVQFSCKADETVSCSKVIADGSSLTCARALEC